MILLGLLSVSKPNFFSLLCQLIKRNKETLLPGNAARLVANTVASARHLEDIGEDLQHLLTIMTVIRPCHQLIKSTIAMHFANDFPFFYYQEVTPFNRKNIIIFPFVIFYNIYQHPIPLPSSRVPRYQRQGEEVPAPPLGVKVWYLNTTTAKDVNSSETEESSVRPSSSVLNLASTSLSRKGLHRAATNLFAAHHQDARHWLCENQLCVCCIITT